MTLVESAACDAEEEENATGKQEITDVAFGGCCNNLSYTDSKFGVQNWTTVLAPSHVVRVLTRVFAYRSTLLERRPPTRHLYIIARRDHEVLGHDDRKLELNAKLVP
jgi:hypothetical protein